MAEYLLVADTAGPDHHVGDEAMLAACRAELAARLPGASFRVIGRADIGVPPEELLGPASGLMICGGGNLSSTWPDLLHQRTGLIRAAARRGIPIATGGQTIGPNLSELDRAELAEALPLVTLLGVREVTSLALALELGVDRARLQYQVDDAYRLAGDPSIELEVPDRFLAVTLDASFVAPADRSALDAIIDQLAGVARLVQAGVVFIPHVGPIDAEVDDDDRAVGRLVIDRLAAQGVAATSVPLLPASAVVKLTQDAVAVVSSRYHPLVFATSVGTPCVGLHRDPYTRAKLEGALAHVGQAADAIDVVDASEGGLIDRFERSWERRRADPVDAATQRARLRAADERRWQRVAATLRAEEIDAPLEGSTFGWPSDEVAAALLLAASPGARRSRGAGTGPMRFDRRLGDESWHRYERDGYLPIGAVVTEDELVALRQRADDLATGVIRNPAVQLQADSGGSYESLGEPVADLGGTLLYRKVQGLEHDDLFRRLLDHRRFREACARVYGPHSPISIFRAMVMNKPAGQGTVLPWHQDGGDVWGLDRDPLLTVWVALDDATVANGCLEVVEGSHRLGLLSRYGSTVADADVLTHCVPERIRHLEVRAGEALLVHNWLIHRSGVNPTAAPRRAFTACFMDGRTTSVSTGSTFPIVVGDPPDPPLHQRHLVEENAELRRSFAAAEEYALSLRDALQQTEAQRREAERYALSLEAELGRRHAPLA